MSNYFKQVVFPSNSTNIDSLKARLIFEQIYCYKKKGWFSMIECIGCKEAEKKLEDILNEGVGC